MVRFTKTILLSAVVFTFLSCHNATRHTEMLRQLERAEEMNSSYTPMDTLQGIEEIEDYFMSHGSAEERTRASYMMGSVYRDRGDSPMALEHFLKAVNQSDTTSRDCNFELLSRIYAQMALLFEWQRYPQKAMEMWEKAIRLAKKADDEMLCTECLSHSVRCLETLGDTAKAIQSLKDSQRRFRQLGRNEYAASISGELALDYLRRDSVEKAKTEIDHYINESKLYKDGEIHPDCEVFLYYLGLYYEKAGKPDSAIYFYRKIAARTKSKMNIVFGYRGLLSVFAKTHETDSVAKYARLYTAATDSANIVRSAEEVSRVQSLYDYTAHKQRALEKTEENHALWRIIFIVVVSAAALALAALRIFRRQRARSIERIRLVNTRYTETLRQYREAQESYRQLKADRSQYEAALRQQIEQLQTALSGYEEIFATNPDEQSLLNNLFVMQFHQYAAQIRLPGADEWAKLEELVSKSLPDFWSVLAAASLTEKERRLSLLTRLNFITSEIAILLEISRQRVSNLRSSLNAKLFQESGATTFTANLFRL